MRRFVRAIMLRLGMLSDLVLRVDFAKPVELQSLGLNQASAHRYAPSGGMHLRRVLNTLPIRATNRVIDIGCGKGSAMRTLVKYPFETVAGLELSDELAAIAAVNFARLARGNIRLFVGDAETYSDYDQFNYFYMYNPFSCEVMKWVRDALLQSVQRQPRTLTVIYTNPTCEHLFSTEFGFERVGVHKDAHGHEIAVFKSRKRHERALKMPDHHAATTQLSDSRWQSLSRRPAATSRMCAAAPWQAALR